jgi:rhodanese-related sulfurtransferase
MSFSIRSITPQQMAQYLRDPEAGPLQLIDVREPAELELVNLNALGFRNYPLSRYEEWRERILTELDPRSANFCALPSWPPLCSDEPVATGQRVHPGS